jgi:hypothetical protein
MVSWSGEPRVGNLRSELRLVSTTVTRVRVSVKFVPKSCLRQAKKSISKWHEVDAMSDMTFCV